MVDSTSQGEKACYYSGVCLETGEVEAMDSWKQQCRDLSTAHAVATEAAIKLASEVGGLTGVQSPTAMRATT